MDICPSFFFRVTLSKRSNFWSFTLSSVHIQIATLQHMKRGLGSSTSKQASPKIDAMETSGSA
jgi:hypothetical protein